MKSFRKPILLICFVILSTLFCSISYASTTGTSTGGSGTTSGGSSGGGAGNVSVAIESTWKDAAQQIKTVVNNVVFPIINLILAVFFFIKLALAYFDYRKQGQFEWVAPAILFVCLVFSLTAHLYIWQILGI